jgi:hypothetical protein
MESDNLEDLKVGDEVALHERFGVNSIEKIKRLTPKSIILVNKFQPDKDGMAFWKKDGFSVGRNNYYYSMISKVTQEFRDKINLDNKVSYLSKLIGRTSFNKLGLDKINKLIEILEIKEEKE